ncbi:carboxylesterase/lipase family protein [Streptomonospora nanhaiensis]|uniref:carboxylesterase/lipase family protein n=1 Tax=Streptomonospora nanhaiensis TaxID=1323731 RepID=UPI001C38FA11|nr:carboxylesterase family protein [Streptomonospora nanhaiensis]MBV2362177.1 carboxylesterase family protein [Streptomonospora nanhaiensis]
MRKIWTAGLGLALLGTLASAAVVGSAGQAAAAAEDPASAVVQTDQGAVRGTVGPEVRSFKGIPYATAERFAKPRPAEGWSGVRDATERGTTCAQLPGYPIGEPSTAEDCLNLNVTTPVGGGEDLPVVFWIHGGSMMVGYGDLYGPDRLAAEGAVVVSVNYRLGPTAFLAHPDLEESGSLALDDQREALRWVRDNIAEFGADPGRVTLMGESGGGFAVCGHLASPASDGLYRQAVIQSAPCSTPGNASRTREEAEADSEQVIKDLGCLDAEDVAACLREVPIDQLLEKYGTDREPRPVSGTPELPLPVDEALRTGRFNRVPVLIGVNHDEENGMVIGAELATGEPMADADYEAAIREDDSYGDDADAVLRRYPLGDSAGATLARVRTDSVWAVPTLDTARALSRHTSTRMYEFAEQDTPWYRDLPEPSFPAAAQHMAELPYMFDMALFEDLTPEQAALGARMNRAWVRFAASGDPNGGGEAAWPRLRDDRGRSGWYVQSLSSGDWRRADFAKDHGYRFWSRLSD